MPYLLDACQSVGQMPIDVERIGCDFLSTTGRKFLRGPRGTGFLYVGSGWAERLAPRRWSSSAAPSGPRGTRIASSPARAGSRPGRPRTPCGSASAAAIDYALDVGVDRIWARISVLAGAVRDGLDALPGVELHDLGRTRCGIVSFSVDGVAAPAVKQRLAERRSTSSCPRSRTRASISRTAA